MLKYAVLLSTLGVAFALAMPSKPVVPAGRWIIDNKHSDVELVTDATTNYGKDKINFTVGVARVVGRVHIANDNPSESTFDFSMYPAHSTVPSIGEDGKLKASWLENRANHTLVCFHSKGTSQTADGRVRASGTLVLTRVDRNVEYSPSEAYNGPVYGPPMVHRMTREATFVFNAPTAAQKDSKDVEVISGSTKVVTEDFPQLYKAVMATYWPPVVQDENCTAPSVIGEDFSGPHCTGTFMNTPGLPQEPRTSPPGEDYGSDDTSGFSAVVGNNLIIAVHLHLKPAPEMKAAAGK